MSERYQLTHLLQLMARLRDPEGGCPWDLAQTFRSIVPSTLEEVYELVDTIEREDMDHLAEELGDLLFQVVFYSQLGQEQARFDLPQIIDRLTAKLLRRHPHVFPDGTLDGTRRSQSLSREAVAPQWEQIKADERQAKAQHGALADVPLVLPALSRAQKLQKRAARVGFDWDDREAVIPKIHEELDEVKEALSSGDRAHLEEELGDLLFACVNLVRKSGMDAEQALRQANRKFERRFQAMESLSAQPGQTLPVEQWEQYWQQVKQQEKHAND